MTDTTLPELLAAIQTSDDGDFPRVLAETTLNRLIDFDADNAIGASPERLSYRNGYRDRVLETRAGALDLKLPKNSVRGRLLSRLHFGAAPVDGEGAHRRHPRGVDQWRVDAPRRRAGAGHGHDRHIEIPVSKLCKEIDERVHSFLQRPLEGDWPYLWLDAT
jgi:transposase-like protein